MERLTNEDGICVDCQCVSYCKRDCGSKKRFDKLKEYEDLGFTPEDIAYLAKFFKDKTSTEEIEANMKTAAKLMEWAKWKDAEDSGRLVILPCKIGDTVYQPGYKFTECSAHRYTPKYECDSECEGCCSKCDSECSPYVYEGRVCGLEVIPNGYVLIKVQFKDKWDNSSFTVGREVFLSREEAEENVVKR